jgi:hypothetical protein
LSLGFPYINFCWDDFLKALHAAGEMRLWQWIPRKRGIQEALATFWKLGTEHASYVA